MKLYIEIKNKNEHIKKFLGINIYIKKNYNGICTKKILGSLYKVVISKTEKKYYICGIKFQQKKILSEIDLLKRNISSLIVDEIRNHSAVVNLHTKIFPKFKNINKGKDLVIIGTGPTVNSYIPIKNAINIGLNRAFEIDKIKLDYLFMVDYNGVKDYIRKAKDYNCKKFYGKYLVHQQPHYNWNIPDYIAEEADAYRFYSDSVSKKIYHDIETAPLMDFASVAFPAIHFALWTHPKRIFLVGCDTVPTGYFDGTKHNGQMHNDIMLKGYRKLKEYISVFYPDIEIISINPVGLKGIFKDIEIGEK